MADVPVLTIKVDLVSGRAQRFEPPPGRMFLVLPHHTFADLFVAIEETFGRWDQAHLFEFTLPDGRTLGSPDDEDGEDEIDAFCHEVVVSEAVRPGDRFSYVFDLGDSWMHECEVLSVHHEDSAEMPDEIEHLPVVSVMGWGTLPDQHGNASWDDVGGTIGAVTALEDGDTE